MTTASSNSVNSERKGISTFRNLAPDVENAESKAHQRQYVKGKTAGICTYAGCTNPPDDGHTKCRSHLEILIQTKKKRYASRVLDAMCVNCGKREGWWGVYCIICRQRFRKGTLPSAARRALTACREAEKQRDIELAQVEMRFAARKLLAMRDVQGSAARALRLYVGADDGVWRTYERVATRMGITKEAVSQLLLPSRGLLESMVSSAALADVFLRPKSSKQHCRAYKPIRYRKRRAAGLCSYGSCAQPPKTGHTYCEQHLQRMSEDANERRTHRIAQTLCTACGKRPQFWGVRCILCRVVKSNNALPFGARRALHKYREAELERKKKKRSYTAAKLITNKRIEGKSAEALILYFGIRDGQARSYRAVGRQMGLSGERVRQLLMRPKRLISDELSHVSPEPRGQRVASVKPRTTTVRPASGNDRGFIESQEFSI